MVVSKEKDSEKIIEVLLSIDKRLSRIERMVATQINPEDLCPHVSIDISEYERVTGGNTTGESWDYCLCRCLECNAVIRMSTEDVIKNT